MGLSPAAPGKSRLRLSRSPGPRPKPASGAASTGPSRDPVGPGAAAATGPLPTDPPRPGLEALLGGSRTPAPRSHQSCLPEIASQALVQLSPKHLQQGTSELDRSVQEGEEPEVNLETTPSQKRAESHSTPKPESASKLAKQAAKSKPRPRPGDLIEIFRIGYEHWAIYVEDDCVVHLAPPSEEFEAGSISSIFSNRAVVKYSRLEDVLHGCSWKINNKLDGTYLPLPVDKIVRRTKKMINKMVQYSLIDGNCEHFVNNLRYGVPRSQQVEHALMKGAKAAGVVISAVVDSIRPKPGPA